MLVVTVVKRFDQSDVRNHSRVPCSKDIIIDANTTFQKTRPCRKSATFYIDNVPMFNAHAGQALLEEALRPG